MKLDSQGRLSFPKDLFKHCNYEGAQFLFVCYDIKRKRLILAPEDCYNSLSFIEKRKLDKKGRLYLNSLINLLPGSSDFLIVYSEYNRSVKRHLIYVERVE